MCRSCPSLLYGSVLSFKDKNQFSKLESCDTNHPHSSEFTDNDSLASVHQVFLSFRGEQLRYSFVSHVLDAFERHGIMCFIDKDELRGKHMTNLFVRIKESNIALVIFSTRYAESSWCMDELVKIMKRVNKGKLKVIPIFYNVNARDVRGQTGEFGDNFWALAKLSRGEQIKEWMEALVSISNIMGLSLEDNRSEADFIKDIVKEVERVLATTGCKDIEDHQRIDIFQNIRGESGFRFSPQYQKKNLRNGVNTRSCDI